jgi:hypothetical protein
MSFQGVNPPYGANSGALGTSFNEHRLALLIATWRIVKIILALAKRVGALLPFSLLLSA